MNERLAQLIADRDHAGIARLLADRPSLRDEYIDAMILEAHLSTELGRTPDASESMPTLGRIEPRAQRAEPVRVIHLRATPTPTARRGWLYAGYGAAAALLIVGVVVAIYLFVNASGDPSNPGTPGGVSVATLVDADGSVTVGDRPGNPGDHYAAGPVAIESGTADFMLASTVGVRLRGYTRMTLVDPMAVVLSRGTAEFNVPPGAHGFTVHLPNGARVVDLGTRFSVHVDDRGRVDVAVAKGVVRLETERPGGGVRTTRLTAGDLVRTDPATGGDPRPVIGWSELSPTLTDARLTVDVQPTTGRLSPGAVAFTPDPQQYARPEGEGDDDNALDENIGGVTKAHLPVSARYDSPFGDDAVLTVTLDTDDEGSLDFRDRSDLSDREIGQLVEDHAKNQNGGLVLTVRGLAPGAYRLVTWHHEAQGSIDAGAAGNSFDVHLSDALGEHERERIGLIVTFGRERLNPTRVTLDVVSDGVSPIVVRFDPTSGDRETPLNAFELTRVGPAPPLPVRLEALSTEPAPSEPEPSIEKKRETPQGEPE